MHMHIYTLIWDLTISFVTVVQVGFEQSSYIVSEADGSASVCVNISGAILNRNVTVLLSTQDNSAVCE